MTSSAAGPSAAPSSGERPSWVEAFFAATPGEKMSDDDIHTCELDGVSHGLQTGCQACHLLDQELNTCARCGSVDHDGPGVSCSSCDRQGLHLCVSCANEDWSILDYDWQCSACRVCLVCRERGTEVTLRVCGQCDRAVHKKSCEGLVKYLGRHRKEPVPNGACVWCVAPVSDPVSPKVSPPATEVVPTPEPPRVLRELRPTAAFVKRIERKHEPALPTLPFELQRLIILEAATSTSAVYEGADLAPWRERQTFLKRACEVSTGWRYVAQPLLYQQPLLAFESRPGVDYNRPLKIFNLGLRIQRPSTQILSTPSGPISLGIFHGSEENEELPLRHYSGLSLPNLASLDAGEDYGSPSRVISLSNLTLETDHHAWGAVINLLLVCDFSSLERICLSVPYCLDATLSVFLLELPRLVDLRINTTTDDLNASEHLQIILASAASRLRVLHLHTIEAVDLDPRLFDGLQRLEELSISTWGISTLFANGRLPRLRRLFIGQPHIKAGELLQQTDDEPLKTIQELVTWAVRTIPNLNRRRGLRLGVWDLDFGGSHRTSAIVHAIHHLVQSKALFLLDRWATEFDPKWARKPVPRPTFGSGWAARKAKKGKKGRGGKPGQ